MLLARERWTQLSALVARYGLELCAVADQHDIPGSYWGAPEAGLIQCRVFARGDTPVHSVLHESAHAICMSATRRAALNTDAGGDEVEENAVCFLQILLARRFYAQSLQAVCADMDAWGYSFRLGSALAWFEHDADDARQWLRGHELITAANEPTFRLRA